MVELRECHRSEYGSEPGVVVSAPGRVNLIGEHTDYNEGFVFPMAIDFCIQVAVSLRKDRQLHFYSRDLSDKKRTSFQNLRYRREDRWANYAKGVISVMVEHGYDLPGLNLSISGQIPQGVGLASSAALEVATAYAVEQLFELDISGEQLAALAREAENAFVGVQCGIMDQFVSRLAEKGHAMLLDTRSLAYQQVPLELSSAKILVTNSNVPRGLIDSEYNQRRLECEQCVGVLSQKKPGTALRDYTATDLRDSVWLIPESTRKKCLHVVEENQRVLEAEAVLRKGDLTSFGKLMNRSHESLRDLYEVSCPELDWLVKRAWETDGVYGSRMTGAGFGGCTVTLIQEGAIGAYRAKIDQYERIFGFKPEFYVCEPAGGATVVHPA